MRFRAPVLTIACLTVGMAPLVRTGTARAAEALIAVDVPAAGCPGRADVVAALESRLPGVTRGRGGSGSARYRLEVNHAAGEAEAPLRLRSLAGGVVLERRLPVEARARPSELCQALAEAAALVVVRYLRDLGYRPGSHAGAARRAGARGASAVDAAASGDDDAAPAPAPPASAAHHRLRRRRPLARARPRRRHRRRSSRGQRPRPVSCPDRRPVGPPGYLGAGAVVRMGLRSDLADVTRGEIAASLQSSGDWWHLEIGGGVSSETRVEVGGATAGELRLRAFPLRAAFGIPLGLGGGQLMPLAGVTLDLTSLPRHRSCRCAQRPAGRAGRRAGCGLPARRAELVLAGPGRRRAFPCDRGTLPRKARSPPTGVRRPIFGRWSRSGPVLWKN